MDKNYIKKVNFCIVKISQGKQEFLTKLFDLTKRQLYVVAKAYLWDKNKAEDILSETYLRVVKYADSFDRKKNGYNWLYEMVKNLSFTQNKKDTAHNNVSLEQFDIPDNSFADLILDKILIESAQENLTKDEKKLIYLYYFEGRTLQEIADMFGKAKSTIYDMQKKALKKMQTKINPNK